MSKLDRLKKWYSLEEAAKRLSLNFETEVTVKDVVQFMIEEQLAPCWFLNSEYYLPVNKMRDEPHFFEETGHHGTKRAWDEEDLFYGDGIFKVLFGHGEHSRLKKRLRAFYATGAEPEDDPFGPATFLEDAQGEIFYLMRRTGEVLESWFKATKEVNGSRIRIIGVNGEPLTREEEALVETAGFDLCWCSEIPRISEIIITKEELDRFESQAQSPDAPKGAGTVWTDERKGQAAASIATIPQPLPDVPEIASVIGKRRRYLEMVYSKDGRQPKQAGLVALSRAIFLLATRHLDHPERYEGDPDELVKDTWELQWLSDYMQALAELIPPIQEAIRAGKLVPRGNKTRAPLSFEQYEPWLDGEPAAVMGHDMLHRAVAGNWPDAEILPSGICVIPAELQAWAESEGIAAPGEVLSMLSDKQDAAAMDAVEPSPAPGGDKGQDETPALSNWKMQIQAEAAAMFKRLRKVGAQPTVHSIIEDLAKWCSANNVQTDTGIHPKASYLRVHVLSGKHWKPPEWD
ncbi:hypothetical protein [Eoetvoesiella caeni]